MADSERILDLLIEWEEQKQRGVDLSAEQLCPNDPDLQRELRMQLEKRRKVQQFHDQTISQPTTEPEAPLPTLAGYEILGVLGSGGMGVVYKAVQSQLRRSVALKMILTGTHATGTERQRFRSEAETVARLNHPNIVQIYEVGEQDHRPYLALEYVGGGSLAEQTRKGPLPPARAAELLLPLVLAVQHAHAFGVIHRDLKPANILLTDLGVPKITDFGLAKQLDNDQSHTHTGAVMGSPSYMAPEQAEGHRTAIGPLVDVYALGAILYEMLTGRPPFLGTTLLETLDHVRTLDPVPPRALQPSVPKDLEVICLKCLEKVPADRYASAAALAEDVRSFLAGEPIRARAPSFLDQMRRNLTRTNFGTNLRMIGVWMILLAPFPPLLLFTLNALFGHLDSYPVLITAVSTAILMVVETALLLLSQPVIRSLPARQRRHFTTCLTSDLIGVPIVWLLLWMVVPADRAELLYLVYPFWALKLADFYFAFAAEAGWFYLTGGAFLLLAIAMVFFLPWLPLILGVLMFLNMTLQGIMILRARDEAVNPTNAE